jgi:DNA-binding XRE family transcriptional regulator
MADTSFRSILARRLHAGLTQEQLADRAGIRRQTLIAMEAGKASPTVEVALDVADVLGCSVEALFRPIPLAELIGWYDPALVDQPAHRAICKAKTPFLIASRPDGGSTTFLNSVLAELGPVAQLATFDADELYRSRESILQPIADPVQGAQRDKLRGARAIVVPELRDPETARFVTALGHAANLPVYATIHAQDARYVGERVRSLTGGDAEAARYWGTPGVLWVDRHTNTLSMEKLMLIEPASHDAIQKLFAKWCADVNDHVCRDEIALQYAWGGHTWPGQTENDRDFGNFSNQGRFVHMSAMRDGRILVSGLEAVIKPIAPGEQIPRGNQLFPGGLATMVSMDESGAELAARAVVAWLSFRDDVLPEIRRQFSQHVASAKNVAGITVE